MRRVIGLWLAMAVLAGGCGGGGSPTTAPTVTEAPTTTVVEEPAEATTTTAEAPADEPAEGPTTTTEAPAEEPTGTTTTTVSVEEPPETTTTTTEAPIVLTDSFRGVTSETIRIGFTSIDFEKFNSTYGFNLTYANYGPTVDTYVAHINATGGILGRMVEIVHGTFLPVGAATAEAVCVELVEDHHIAVAHQDFLDDAAFEMLHDLVAAGGDKAALGNNRGGERRGGDEAVRRVLMMKERGNV